MTRKLTGKQEAFVREYLVDLSPSAAARRAGYTGNVKQSAYDLLRHPLIAAQIQAEMAKRAERVEIQADEVLKHFWTIATADPRELIEYRRSCCHYCWGKGNRYQRTAGEMERDKASHARLVLEAEREGRPAPGRFDQQGGVGYHAKREVNPACGECFGDGVGTTRVADTAQLSAAAARLYAGVKQTKEGLEVKTLDQQAALVNVARHLGMFNDKIDANVSGAITVNIKQF